MFFSSLSLSLSLSDLVNSNSAVQIFFLRRQKTTLCICTSQILDFDWNLTKWSVMPETNQNSSKLYLRWNKGMPFQFAYWYEIFCPFRPEQKHWYISILWCKRKGEFILIESQKESIKVTFVVYQKKKKKKKKLLL